MSFDKKKYHFVLTSEFLVYSVDFVVQQTKASLLNLVGCCYSGPALSKQRTENLEQKTELHSSSLTGNKHQV